MRRRFSATLAALAVTTLAVLPAPSAQAQADTPALVRERCTACHNLNRVRDRIGKNSEKDWSDYIGRMQKRGARVDDAQKSVMAAYLATLASGDAL
ncbi:hypothetical protein ASZ90_001627 [hydrocarbon metagenome]|uniref:Quinohemoprotein amine dehydrogenase alpha subunit haem binding domain-containing protein n=1 Tax=hydrocarbon metagenome TaxID=938273 RepID=A0A0W8G632_9ZZZZ